MILFLCAVLFDRHWWVRLVNISIVTGSIAILFFRIWDDIVSAELEGIQLTFQISLGVALFTFSLWIFSCRAPFVEQVFVTLPGSGILDFLPVVFGIMGGVCYECAQLG